MDAEELMNEVLAEAERFDDLQAMGNYSASPFSPEGVAARFKELGASAVPYLIACVEGGGDRRRWALVALEAMGIAARAASDALVAQLDVGRTPPDSPEVFLEYLGEQLGLRMPAQRVSFAAILAERSLGSAGKYADWEPRSASATMRDIVEAVWDHASGQLMAPSQLSRFDADLSDISVLVDPDRLGSEEAYRGIRLLGLATRCCGPGAGVADAVAVARESLHIAAGSFLPEHHVGDGHLRRQWNSASVRAEAGMQRQLLHTLRPAVRLERDTVAALRRDFGTR